MLYVVNPEDCIHTKSILVALHNDMDYYVLDTDDLSVEKVNGAELRSYIKAGIQIFNVTESATAKQTVITTVPFSDYFSRMGEPVVCLGGRLKILNRGSYEFNKTIYKFSGIMDDGYELCLNSKLLVKYDTHGSVNQLGVAYIYKCGDRFILRNVIQIQFVNVYTTLILGKDGKVLSVIPDPTCDVKSVHKDLDSSFTTKFKSLQERLY